MLTFSTKDPYHHGAESSWGHRSQDDCGLDDDDDDDGNSGVDNDDDDDDRPLCTEYNLLL